MTTDRIPDKTNLLGMTHSALREYFTGLGESPFRATQVMQWAHQHGIGSFEAMTNLGKLLRTRLNEIAELRAPAIHEDQLAADGTRKWLLGVDGINNIEMVFIPERDRGTLCISSQVGCTLNCAFCATGHQGFNRNLTTAEIIGQVWIANRLLRKDGTARDRRPITNIVFMGMGEPLLNLDNVVEAIEILRDDYAYGISWRRITVSTAGLVPLIDELKVRAPVSLAVSLHAPNDVLRDKLVPLNRKYPIAELLAACRRYIGEDTRRRITFEYIMLAGVNDSPAHARELATLLRDVPSKINLIPYNPFPQGSFSRSDPSTIDRFRDAMMEAGYVTVTRKTRGDDIDAACGQLAGRFVDRTRRRERLPGVTVTSR